MARLDNVRRVFGLPSAAERETARRVFIETSDAIAKRLDANAAAAGAFDGLEARFQHTTDQQVRELIQNTAAGSAIGFRTNAIGSARLGAYQEIEDDAGGFEELDADALLSVFASKLAEIVGMIEFDLITAGRAFVWINKVTADVRTWEVERLDPANVEAPRDHQTAGRRDGVSLAERSPREFIYRDPEGGYGDELRLDPLNCLMLETDQHLPELFQATKAIQLLDNIYALNVAYFEKGVLPGRYSFNVAWRRVPQSSRRQKRP